jgi:nitroreductase
VIEDRLLILTLKENNTMQYLKPVTALIQERISIRSYLDTPVAPQTRAELETCLTEATQGPLGSFMRFMFIGPTDENRQELSGLMTYGMIKNPMGYVIGAVARGPHAMEDYGYVMEQIVLKCTDLGLGTCWVAATFNKSTFAKKIGIGKLEDVAAILPLGNPPPKRTLRENILRGGLGARKRKPWEDLFFQGSKPLSRAEAGLYAIPLDMVRLGPSSSNKQPWRILKQEDLPVFHFYVKRNFGYRQLAAITVNSDTQRVDVGIAMCHFELSALEAGQRGVWSTIDPRLKEAGSSLEFVDTWTAAN